MKRSLFAGAICALILVSLPACDSNGGNDETPDEAGTFTATIEGAIDAEVSGSAFSSGTGSAWALVLASSQPTSKTEAVGSGDDESFSFVRALGGRPGEGTYSIFSDALEQSEDFIGSVYVGGTFYSEATGNLVVTSSSSSSVRGTFAFNATNGSETITVEGAFNSINTEFTVN